MESVVIAPPPPLVARADAGSGRLSYQQEAWLEVERAEMVGYRSAAGLYTGNNHVEVTVRSVDRAALDRALAAVVERHECLRTTFDDRGATVVARAAPPIASRDASGAADPLEHARHLAVDAVLEPFAYDRDVLCRGTLIRVSRDEDLLVLVVPHLVSDGVSLKLLKQEIRACYAHELGASPPPPVAAQYRDFVDWQRKWLGVDARSDLARYYETRISGASTAIVHSSTAPARRTWRSAGVAVTLAGSATAAVHAVSWRARVAPVVLLLAVYQIAVRVWSGCEDALIAVPFAGRRGHEMAELIGFFACHALIRSSAAGDPTFTELLARVAVAVNEAYANLGTPYGALVDLARERGDPDPPMKLCMNIQPAPIDADENGAIRWTPVPIESYGTSRLTRWDLNLMIRRLSKETIAGDLRYCVDVFDETTAQWYARQFLALIDAATDNPSSRISAIVRSAVARRE